MIIYARLYDAYKFQQGGIKVNFLNILAISTCTALLLIGCGGSDKDEQKADQTIVEKTQNPKTENKLKLAEQVAQKPSVKKALTLWDTAIEFDDKNLLNLYFLDSTDLLEKREFIKFEACRSGSNNYDDMAKNEFSFEDFLSTAKTKSIERVNDFKTSNNLSDGNHYLVRVNIDTNLGDYNFENESFTFVPIKFDYLREGHYANYSCRDNDGKTVSKPDLWPEEFQFYFDNKNLLKTLSLSKSEAKKLIDGMTQEGNTSRSVRFEFIFALQPKSMLYIAGKQSFDDDVAKANVKIVQARVLTYERYRENEVMIAEYPKSFFE